MNGKTTRKEFLELAQYDDRLLQLERRIKAHANLGRINKNYCANSAWYRIFKREVVELVGWNADDIRLQSSRAYETVYDYLYNLLPDCTCESSFCGLYN
jgi:hypothetical protein